MLTPENDKGPLKPTDVQSGTVQPLDAALSRVNTPLGKRLSEVAQGLAVSLEERKEVVRILLEKGPSAQAERREILQTLADLLSDDLARSGVRSLLPRRERAALLELGASFIGGDTLYDMATDLHERWITGVVQELSRLTCVERWESGHFTELKPTLEMLNELLFAQERPRPLSEELRVRTVVAVGRFLGKVERELFVGVPSLELEKSLGDLYRTVGLLRDPSFAEKLEDLIFATFGVCESMMPDSFGEQWRVIDAQQQEQLDECDEDDEDASIDEPDEFEGDDEIDLDAESQREEQNIAAELFHDLLIAFTLSGGAGRADFWPKAVASISHTTKTLGAALLGLSTCSEEIVRQALVPLIRDSASEPTALMHIVNLMCSNEVYKGHTLMPCDKLVQDLVRKELSLKERKALRVTETFMFKDLCDLLYDPELARKKVVMLR